MLPPEVYPVAVYSCDRRATPGQVRVESSEAAILLWIDGLMIGVSRTADDTHLDAAMDTAYSISQASERFASLVRSERERRDRAREAEPAAAAMRAAEHAHPVAEPAGPVVPPMPIVRTP